MSDYTKLTDFASKDALPSGSPLKIVKGTEINNEFVAIANAISTKPDTTDVDAQIEAAKESLWPVGSVYINASSSVNPATLLGFGTWTEIGAGKVLVGQDTEDTDFDTLAGTGGSKDAVVVSHTHSGSTDSAGSHAHSYSRWNGGSSSYGLQAGSGYDPSNSTTGSAGSHSHSVTVNSAGESGEGKNVQPYIVVKMWQRTA